MAKNKNICSIKSCMNYQKYCRLHQGYVVPEKKAIAKVSDNQKEILKKYKPIRSKFLKEHPVCMAALQGCTKAATEVHHMKGKVSEQDYLNDKFFLAVCHNCHQILEKNPAFAKQNGFSISRLSKEQNKRA